MFLPLLLVITCVSLFNTKPVAHKRLLVVWTWCRSHDVTPRLLTVSSADHKCLHLLVPRAQGELVASVLNVALWRDFSFYISTGPRLSPRAQVCLLAVRRSPPWVTRNRHLPGRPPGSWSVLVFFQGCTLIREDARVRDRERRTERERNRESAMRIAYISLPSKVNRSSDLKVLCASSLELCVGMNAQWTTSFFGRRGMCALDESLTVCLFSMQQEMSQYNPDPLELLMSPRRAGHSATLLQVIHR